MKANLTIHMYAKPTKANNLGKYPFFVSLFFIYFFFSKYKYYDFKQRLILVYNQKKGN
ncbi:hypothetical protein SAMN05660862_1133 [Sphingobacterium psychroaquaticum]|uniref:Uncharacterized protein n=1 Tax=Sphingobacterium psychroaquaticum TaxID=561061 RepID=A0A1X7IQG5_9SPHI|nr:hypothetical protein SAMN05660862_1133 [Sphingobacterium psychroaquaticum]